MNKNRVFCSHWLRALAAADVVDCHFRILVPIREMLLKSAYTQIWLRDDATALNIPLEQNTNIIWQLDIGIINQQIADNFEILAGLAPAIMGQTISIYKPGQINFNAFYINEYLNLFFYITNHGIAPITFNFSLAIEVEEIKRRYAS
jgi:hypothetical protein